MTLWLNSKTSFLFVFSFLLAVVDLIWFFEMGFNSVARLALNPWQFTCLSSQGLGLQMWGAMPRSTLLSTPNPLLRLSTFLPVPAMVIHTCWWPKAGQKSLWYDSVILSTLGLFSQRRSLPNVSMMSDLLLTLSCIHIISRWVVFNLLLLTSL